MSEIQDILDADYYSTFAIRLKSSYEEGKRPLSFLSEFRTEIGEILDNLNSFNRELVIKGIRRDRERYDWSDQSDDFLNKNQIYFDLWNEYIDSLSFHENSQNPPIEKDVIPDVNVKTQKDQIRLLYDLGIIDFLVGKYPNSLKHSQNQVSKLISKIINVNNNSIQPTINALLSDTVNKNYPKQTTSIKSIIDNLDANESK